MNARSISISISFDNELLKEIFSTWLSGQLDVKFHVFFSIWADKRSSDDTAEMLNALMQLLYDRAKKEMHQNRFLLRKYIITVTALLIEASKYEYIDIDSINRWERHFSTLDIRRAETDLAFSGLAYWHCWTKWDRKSFSPNEQSLLREYEVTDAEKLQYSNMIECMHQFEGRQYFAKFSKIYLILGEETESVLSGIAEGFYEAFYIKYNALNVQYFQPFLSQLLAKEEQERRAEFLLYFSSAVRQHGRLLSIMNKAYISSIAKYVDEFAKITEMAFTDCSVDDVKRFIDKQLKSAYSCILRFDASRGMGLALVLSVKENEVLKEAKNHLKKTGVGAAIAGFFNMPREIGVEMAQYLEPASNMHVFFVNRAANNAARQVFRDETPRLREFIKIV